jgi:putative membrane protein
MIRNVTVAVAALAAVITGSAALAQSSSSSSSMMASSSAPASAATSPSATDGQFLSNAIQTDDEEIAIGGIALARSTTTAVRDFGLMLVTDHRHSRIEAENLAQKDGVQIPPDLAPDAMSEVQKLMGLSGDAFDQEFASAMVAGHTQAISAFEAEARNKGRVPGFAERTLPALRKHLEIAQAIEAKLSGTSASSASSMQPASDASSISAPSSLEPSSAADTSSSAEAAPSDSSASSSSAM